MASRHELIAIYKGPKHTSCVWPCDDGTETLIGRVEQDDGEETFIKVNQHPGQLVRNLVYRFFGHWKEFRGVDQFVAESFCVETPAGEEAVVAYLCQCRGIGPVMARSIFRLYGDDSVRMLREQPDDVAGTVQRFSIEKAREAAEFLKASQTTERSKIDLFGLLKGRGFPKKVIDKVLADFGAESSQIVARNPYILMRYKGCGFAKCDEMYIDLGLNPLRMKRQALCAWYSINREKGGDTWHRFYVVQNGVKKKISSAKVDIERALKLAIRAKLLSERFSGGQRWIAEYSKEQQETRLAKLIVESEKERDDGIKPVLWKDIVDSLDDITDHQREQGRLATQGFISVLSGLPGCGKTYLAARIIKELAKRYGESDIAVCALAGKAAVKITSEMEKVGLGIQATTIHSLLGIGNANGFHHCRLRPLPYRFVVVDESSMPGVPLFLALLEARAEGAHILVIGDENQLPPIEHGSPLRDFIASNVTRGHLTEIKRQGTVSRIVRACHQIVKESRFTPSPKLDLENGEDFLFIERDDAESQIEALTAVIENQIRRAEIDPIWDIQIIVPVNGSNKPGNSKSPIGRYPLNVILQQILNPDGYRVAGNPFRVGDKIVCRKTGDYKPIASSEERITNEAMGIDNGNQDPQDNQPIRIRNGEMAEVLEVTETSIIARLTFPDRLIMIRRAATPVRDGDDDDSDDDSEDKPSPTGCDFELGYACSGHAYQGCEVRTAIVMIDGHSTAKMVSSKQWIFTGYSRGKTMLIAIGKMKDAMDMCKRDALNKRKTLLKEMILELRKPKVVPLSDEYLELLLEGV